MSSVTLILGGARSGKSRHAEALAAKHRGRKTYIATAEALDEEMCERIAKHRERRGRGWALIEAPLDLVPAVAACKTALVLIDCVTVWIGNLMHCGRDVRAEVERLCDAIEHGKSRIIIVSNEVGLSIVPDNALARAFRDEQGFANQRLAQVAGEVIFVAAGLPVVLKKPRRRRGSAARARSSRGRRA